jgi:ABC-type bacteriocin/lantibiotic exporter with double-glycine peptidase domain
MEYLTIVRGMLLLFALCMCPIIIIWFIFLIKLIRTKFRE